MGNAIAPQMREKLESLEAAVMASGHLSALVARLDSSNALDFCNLHFFVSQELERRFAELQGCLVGVEHA